MALAGSIHAIGWQHTYIAVQRSDKKNLQEQMQRQMTHHAQDDTLHNRIHPALQLVDCCFDEFNSVSSATA